MKFSLILATYGRKEKVKIFFDALARQAYKNFELIVVDQNEDYYIKELCKIYENQFDIKYIHSEIRSLSHARNIGTKIATGDVIAFPDDDCEYYKDTLDVVKSFLSFNKDIDVVLGRIIDKTGHNVIRNWSKEEIRINKYNFFLNYSSVTLFVRSCSGFLNFSEDMGVGTYYGSYEDADYVYRLLTNSKKIIYTPEIKIYHPIINKNDLMKMYSYGLGFGFFCRKNLSIPIIYIFTGVLIFHSFRLIKYIIKFDKKEINKIKKIVGSKKRFYKYNATQ